VSDDPAPKPRSARERQEEARLAVEVIEEQFANCQTELARAPFGSDQRYRLRRRLAEVRAELEDARAEVERLKPAVAAEAEAERHAARVAEWEAAREEALAVCGDAYVADLLFAELVRRLIAMRERATAAAEKAGVSVPPWHLRQPLPTLEALIDIVSAKAALAAGLPWTEFPARFQDAMQPAEAVRRASFLAEFIPLVRFVEAAHPDRVRAAREKAEAEAAARRKREAEELARPLPRLPSQPPQVFRNGVPLAAGD
jgi:hypothetical protein